jgi:tetratricopeptide (TPR) repeat protein
MKRLFSFFLLAVLAAHAQVTRIMLPAGSPEDKALQAIANEEDAAKRVAMLQEFLKAYAANPQAVAYGEWQLSQSYSDAGDTANALAHGQKAVELQPGNLEILIAVATVAQKAKSTDTVMDCVIRGGTAFNGIAKKTRPEGMDPEDFKLRLQQEQEPYRQSYEYLEVTGLNAMVGEQDARKRMGYVERYIAAFPGSRFEDQVMQLAVYTLGQTNDSARLLTFGEKALAANPNSVSMLVALANSLAESSDQKLVSRAESYAHQALDLCSKQVATEENKLALYAGLAHSALGYAMLKQEKNVPAIAELKVASTDLKSTPDAYSAAMYRLGFAYAKTGKLPEAKATLTEVARTSGPYEQPAKDLLAKVEAAAKKAPRAK